MSAPISQEELFESEFRGPPGFIYRPAFITCEEESALLDIIRELPLQEAKFQQYTARRRTVRYGTEYDPRAKAPDAAPGIPEFLFPLRDRIAWWIELPAESFVHGLVTEYRPGTPLGWHRDAPDYEAIAGVSLGGACRMRFAAVSGRRAPQKRGCDFPGARAAFGLSDSGRSSLGMAAQYRGDETIALFDHVSHGAALTLLAIALPQGQPAY